jgi:peptidoglycan/xylan/chitin deacetylase (PgdA/CDA1 family)
MTAYGIMFHHFTDAAHPRGQGAIDAGELTDLIRHIGPDRILPARQWAARAIAGTLRDEVCLTFDDNLKCQFDVAVPVLREFGLTAFFFVYTSVLQGSMERLEIYRAFRTSHFRSVDEFYDEFFEAIARSPHRDDVGRSLQTFVPALYLSGFEFYTESDRRFRFVRDEVLGPEHYNAVMDEMMSHAGVDVNDIAAGLWMTGDNLKQLHAEGHVIGLHSHTHPTRLERLGRDRQYDEYARNSRYLSDLLGAPPIAMSHPCNSYNVTTLPILKELGVQIGFRANTGLQPFGMFEWPREDHCNLLRQIRRAA